MTEASPRRHTGAAQGRRSAPRGALVAFVVIALAIGGVRIGGANAAEVPPAIVLDLREGIGVASVPAAAQGAGASVGEPIAVGDSASISPGTRAESLEGVSVGDAAAVSLGARGDLGEGVRVSDLTTTKLGIHLLITESIRVADQTDVALSTVNAAPVVTPPAAQSAAEGAAATIGLGSFADVGDAGPWTVTVDWGDGSPPTTSTVVAPGPLTGAHTYANGPATHAVRVSVTDPSGLTGEVTFTVTVANSPPTLTPPTLDPAAIDEGGTVSLAGGLTDPGQLDTHTVVIDWGDGSAPTTLALGAGTLTFSASHRYVDDDPTGTTQDPYTIRITATDRDGGSAATSTPVTVRNVAPVLGAITAPTTPQPVGTAVSVSAPFSDVGTADTHTGTWDWGDGTTSAATISETNGSGTASGTHTYTRAGTFTVTLTLVDDDGGRASASVTTAANAPPVVTPPAAQSAAEGAAATIGLGSFADGADDGPWTVTVDWGDGASHTSTTTVSGPLGAVPHTYADGPSTWTVRVTVTDRWGLGGTATFTVAVANVAPTPTITGAPAAGPEGTAVTLNASATDPSAADAAAGFTFSWRVTRGGAPFATGSGASFSFTPNDDGSYAVELTATDRDGGSAATSTPVTVRNVAPVLGAITAPTTPQPVGTAVSVSAPFSDVGTADTHTGTWDWGDGTTSAATISETNGSGTASGTHTYTRAGTFTVTLTLVDDDGGRATASVGPLVVYDRDGGFVTAGGSFTSPAGALASDPSRSGRATFGLEAKYQKGLSVPTGQTEVQVHGGLRFRSTAYSWLVVSGGRAQYAGTGTIDGRGDYGFLVTLTDGGTGGGADRIRVKVWDRTSGIVMYDTQPGAADGAAATAAIAGSVVVHR